MFLSLLFKSTFFVTGGYDVDLDRPHNKTELYSLENESWSRYADSPYPNGVVHHATVKYEYNTFYTFGGLAGDEELTTIARCGYYYDFEWTIMGNMNTGRYRHSVALVFADVEILIIGGCCRINQRRNVLSPLMELNASLKDHL